MGEVLQIVFIVFASTYFVDTLFLAKRRHERRAQKMADAIMKKIKESEYTFIITEEQSKNLHRGGPNAEQ